MPTNLELSIQDPSGQVRRVPIQEPAHHAFWLGRAADAPAQLKDSTLPSRAGWIFRASETELWIKAEPAAPAFRLGPIESREARLIHGLGIRWGQSELRLVEPASSRPHLPEQPAGARPWLTQSRSGRKLLWDVHKAAATPLSLYLAGETGTGKEVLAHLIHCWSDRASGPFVPLNCAALSLSLVESELFGHVKGAYTGAHQHRVGALLQAHNGTLFLDEVGDLPPEIQVKLLRFLEDGEIRAVGSDSTSRASVRVVAATHKPLKALVESGQFRRDLYYRLASVTLRIPPLRDRPEDVALLAHGFASESRKTITPDALIRLQSYGWPGNVRELRHAIDRACAFSGREPGLLSDTDLDFLLDEDRAAQVESLPILSIHEMERHLLLKSLRVTRGNRSEAAKLLGVARSTLFEMIKRHGVVNE